MEDWRNGGFGLYLHWPFCQSKCPYCDFNSHVSATIDQKRWKAAYLSEIARLGAATSDRVLQTVFFGGGTPSLMDPELIDDILTHIRKTWRVANDWEVTLEANPSSVETGRLAGFKAAGVNRVSMGFQALNDRDLKRLGRLHTVSEGRIAFDKARTTFDRVSFDLIYARQDQSLAEWRNELGEALAMAADHMSLYQLTIEDGTAFGDRFKAGKLRGLPEEGLGADLYTLTQELCEAAGLPAYEVSNHARIGAESRHNMIYWTGGDYGGIGPGAHGRLTLDGVRYAVEAEKAPGKWLQSVEGGKVLECRDAVSHSEQGLEYLMMGLRVTDGISLKRFEGISGGALSKGSILELVEIGMVDVQGDRLRTTREGRLVLNAVISRLAA